MSASLPDRLLHIAVMQASERKEGRNVPTLAFFW